MENSATKIQDFKQKVMSEGSVGFISVGYDIKKNREVIAHAKMVYEDDQFIVKSRGIVMGFLNEQSLDKFIVNEVNLDTPLNRQILEIQISMNEQNISKS